MIAHFTDYQKTLLRGKSSAIANKYGCSKKYVQFIINGERIVKSELSKKINKDLIALIELFTPETTTK